MKSVRNLSISALTLLTVLFFSFYGCQKETALANPPSSDNQDKQVEIRGCEYTLAGVYPNLVNGRRAITYSGSAIKSDKSTFTNVPIVWKGNMFTAEGAAGVSGFIEKNEDDERSKLRKVLGLAPVVSDAREAHHIIPAQWWKDTVVTIAGLMGFHPTHGFNGIPLSIFRRGGAGLHATHPAYNDWIIFQLRAFRSRNIDPRNTIPANYRYICNNWVQCKLIPEAINRINNAAYANESINETFKRFKSAGFTYIGDF